ncbi:acyl carrier protein [Streptomyces sp. NPDC001549]|uniref:acyl carrier protein n=1 Tax=Streptomyces sp. NPDC001549 TaxID=3364586 RepID=UPI0036A99614
MTETQDTHHLTAAELRPLIRKIWEEVLQHTDFTDDDRFFSLPGGNSLTAVQVMVVLGRETGSKLPMRLIIRHKSVAELAAAIAEQAGR